ncbi:unnamed protein product [Urochloa humidicola]
MQARGGHAVTTGSRDGPRRARITAAARSDSSEVLCVGKAEAHATEQFAACGCDLQAPPLRRVWAEALKRGRRPPASSSSELSSTSGGLRRARALSLAGIKLP